MQNQELIEQAYQAFNRRDIDAALRWMDPEVDWPNGMEGGYVHGHAAVRVYWTRQWTMINPRVDPVRMAPGPAGETVVDVHQVVCDMAGKVILDQMVQHIYWIENDQVK